MESDAIFADEIPDLYTKLVRSPGVNSSDLEAYGDDHELSMYCISIFDTRTQKLVSPEGYAVIDLPERGSRAHFGAFTATFIGTGGKGGTRSVRLCPQCGVW